MNKTIKKISCGRVEEYVIVRKEVEGELEEKGRILRITKEKSL